MITISKHHRTYKKGGEVKEGEVKYKSIPKAVKDFMPIHQQKVINTNIEEFQDVIEHLEKIITNMPKVYETDEIALKDKLVYLHYFYGGSDWYIFEKDSEQEQIQAFGYAVLSEDWANAEAGYINIEELRETNKVELDFHFEPLKFSEIEKKKDRGIERNLESRPEFRYGSDYGVPLKDGEKLQKAFVDKFGYDIEYKDHQSFVIRIPQSESYPKFLVNDNGGEFNIEEMIGGKWEYRGSVAYNITGGLKSDDSIAYEINDIIEKSEWVAKVGEIVFYPADELETESDNINKFFYVSETTKEDKTIRYTLTNKRTPEELKHIGRDKFHILNEEETKDLLTSKLIDAIKGDSIAESVPLNNLVSGKNQHEINEIIRKLVKEKGTDKLKYSPQELQLLESYEGSGGLAKEGEKGARLFDQFFTPDEIIKKMWGLAVKHGFKFQDTNILEPSVGVGRFLKYIPVNEVDSVHTFEVDETCYLITKTLYPEYHHSLNSFESLFFEGNRRVSLAGVKTFYDLVIGNPPYRDYISKYAPLGEKDATLAATFDQYFMMRGVDVLKEGGLLVYIIPSSFMNNKNSYNEFKEKLSEKADLLEAFRLPSGIFGNTSVTTDLIVLRKKSKKLEMGGGVDFLEPAVVINMDNYKPYSNTDELKQKSENYLKSLLGIEFSLKESNPNIKFKITNDSIKHTLFKAGEIKLIITRQIEEIFKQGYIQEVQNDDKHSNVDHVLKCRTYISINGILYDFYFVLKMLRGGEIYFYDGAFNYSKPV